MTYIGIIFAVIALLSWGFGDFFIQKASRRTGIFHALFYITAAAAVILLPFVWKDLSLLSTQYIFILAASGVIIFATALLQFKALTVGKLAVVEPLISFELPLTVLFAAFLGREHLSLVQYIIISVVFLGILFTVTPHHNIIKHYFQHMERGTWLGLAGAAGMALTNFVIGTASQETRPLTAIWATHTVVALLCLVYLIYKREIMDLPRNFAKAPLSVIAETILDNAAWIAYAFAVIYIPIAVAITLSEGYIILAVVLGVVINREKLKHHQLIGVILAVGGVLLLSALSI